MSLPIDLDPPDRGEALASKMLTALTLGTELLTVELGRRLGLYAVLAESAAMRPGELATAAGIAPRYAREWLEQQAAAGHLDVVDPDAHEDDRKFFLPPALAPVLVNPEHPLYLLGIAPILESLALTLPAVTEAYRSGVGVSFSRFGSELREGIAALNRPGFANDLPQWIAALPDIALRLQNGGRVLDAGCGVGWSTLALAEAFPRAQVVGVDLDGMSVTGARSHALAAGLADRVHFRMADAQDRAADPVSVDLVTVFEALHDMGEPVRALESFRLMLTPGGAVLVADEKVADRFEAPATEAERMQYAISVLHCLPATLAESATVANGTVLRAPTVRRWALEAGFTRCTELPISHDFWRFYRLD